MENLPPKCKWVLVEAENSDGAPRKKEDKVLFLVFYLVCTHSLYHSLHAAMQIGKRAKALNTEPRTFLCNFFPNSFPALKLLLREKEICN